MKIPNKFSLGFPREAVPDIKQIFGILKKTDLESWRGEFSEKEKMVEVEFSFSDGEREPRGGKFILKKWFKSGYYNSQKVFLVFEKKTK